MSSETAASPPERSPSSKRQRWLLVGSLALNLFFIGVAASMLLFEPGGGDRRRDRSVGARIERIASVLPEPDAAKLRSGFESNRLALESARANYDASREALRDMLRREPFDADAFRAALAQRRAARQNYDQVLHGLFAGAIADMSPEGRRGLADWRRKWRQMRSERK